MLWKKKQTAPEAPQAPKVRSIFSTDLQGLIEPQAKAVLLANTTALTEGTMDNGLKMQADAARVDSMPDAQFLWYASQSFIGYQACAILAQNWIVDKACLMPARDAVRQGFDITGVDDATQSKLKQFDKSYGLNKTMREFIHMGRVFGIRIAIFRVNSADPDYYEKPFNIDGVMPGTYQGISQVDPIWVTPILTDASLKDPGSIRFYEPTFWMVNGQKYHRTHLAIYIPHPVTDVLKPMYQYGGVSVSQLIFERVYAAERTANEAPQLAMTKRVGVLKLNAATAFSNLEKVASNLLAWVGLRDNYGVKVVDKESEDYTQFDTSLADFDAVTMNQYQLVAAIAEVPATKLLGTQPKGFNSTGEHEAENYRQMLESIQSNDLEPLVDRHHQLVMKSEFDSTHPVSISWLPLDSPTAQEWAQVNLSKAQAAQIYAGIGAIDGMDIREHLRMDKNSDFFGLQEIDDGTEETPPATE